MKRPIIEILPPVRGGGMTLRREDRVADGDTRIAPDDIVEHFGETPVCFVPVTKKAARLFFAGNRYEVRRDRSVFYVGDLAGKVELHKISPATKRWRDVNSLVEWDRPLDEIAPVRKLINP